MSLWKKTGTVHVDLYRRKTLWERIKAFLDGFANICAVLLVLVILFAVFQ